MTTLLFYIFRAAVTKVIRHCKDNGMMLPLSKTAPQHFARCGERYEYEEKEIVLNFAAFIPVTCIDSCGI